MNDDKNVTLTDKEYMDVLRHFLKCVKQRDPVGYELIMKNMESDHNHPRSALLHCIMNYTRVVQPATKGTHGKILELLNQSIEGDVCGVRIMLLPHEQKIYERKYVDLTPSVDKSEFVNELKALSNLIETMGREQYERGHSEE